MTGSMIAQTFVDGIMSGSVYATIAVGLSIAFGLMRIVNWAQGELLMVSLYIAFFLVDGLGMDPYLSVIITAPAMFLIGYILQRFVLNKLLEKDKAREPRSILLFTSALGMLLSNLFTYIFSSNSKYTTTKYTSTSFQIGELFFSKPKVISGLAALAATLLLYYVIQKTEFGRALRATSQNRQVAQLMGIDNNKVYALAFGIGIALVGLAGSLLIVNTTVYPTIGGNFSTKCFIIVVLGGRGSVPGCLIGGMLVGLIERFGTLFLSDTYSQLILFAIFFVFLMFRPNGLFGKES